MLLRCDEARLKDETAMCCTTADGAMIEEGGMHNVIACVLGCDCVCV